MQTTIASDDEIHVKTIRFQDVTVIIFDVGKNAAEREAKDGPTFFEQEKNCVEKILLRKVLVIFHFTRVIKTNRHII